MKNITKIIIALFAIVAFSCTQDDVENRPVITPTDAPVLTAPTAGAAYVFTPENAAATAERFTWTPANFGGAVEVTYAVEMDKKGGDFSNPVVLGSAVSEYQVAVTVEVMNNAALTLLGDGAVSGVPADFDIRVTATTGTSTSIVSTITGINITPYIDALLYPFTDWFLIGAAVEGGWDNNATTVHQPMYRDGVEANKYSFTGYFLAGNFKLISEKGSWASQLGKASDGVIHIQDNAGEFTIPTAGYYTFKFDTTALTYSLVAYDASAAPTYASVGLAGDANLNGASGWDVDTDLVKSTFNSHVWSVTVDLNKGGAKFRVDDAWAKNWGGATEFSAIGNGSDSNIPVRKSKFTIFFSDLDGSYSMIPNQE